MWRGEHKIKITQRVYQNKHAYRVKSNIHSKISMHKEGSIEITLKSEPPIGNSNFNIEPEAPIKPDRSPEIEREEIVNVK